MFINEVDNFYIADGHHRAASASRVHKEMTKNNSPNNAKESYNYFLATIFPHDEMQIMGYNRVVKDLCGLSDEQFIYKLKEKFDIQKLSNKRGPKERFSLLCFLEIIGMFNSKEANNQRRFRLKARCFNSSESYSKTHIED